MAIASTVVVEVDSATGNDLNGGGFDAVSGVPGTDYTYGAGATYFAYTDLVIGSTTTQLSSSARSFVAADVGNLLRIASGTGFTAGVYQVMSVSGGVATMDRSVGTASSTGGTGRLGGSLASPGIAAATATAAGNTVYIKDNGTYYAISSTSSNIAGGILSFSNGSVSNHMKLRGYGTTRGDTGRATLKWTIDGGAVYAVTGDMLDIRNIKFDGNRAVSSSRAINAGSRKVIIKNCVFKSFGSAIMSLASASAIIDSCEFYDGNNCSFGGSFARFVGCYFHDYISGDPIYSSNVILKCIFDTMPSYGISVNYGQESWIFDCTFYNIAANAINIGGDAAANIYNCIFDSITGAAIYHSGSTARIYARDCAYYSCSSGLISSPYTVDNSVAIAAGSPLTDPANGDFTINSTASRGALARGLGAPASFPGLSLTSYPDFGAVRHQDAGTGTVIVIED